jgi:hypothetical protein
MKARVRPMVFIATWVAILGGCATADDGYVPVYGDYGYSGPWPGDYGGVEFVGGRYVRPPYDHGAWDHGPRPGPAPHPGPGSHPMPSIPNRPRGGGETHAPSGGGGHPSGGGDHRR